MRIAYLGPAETFTHMAAVRHFGRRAAYLDVPSLEEIFARVERGDAEYGVVPVENSIEGAVTHTLDLLPQARVVICGEILLPVQHHLVSTGSARRIRAIFSHPQAFGQCHRWLQRHCPEAYRWQTSSTMEAVRLLTSKGRIDVPLRERAAIAPAAATKMRGMRVIASSIEDYRHNTTRFLVIGRAPLSSSTGRQKTSVLFALKDRPGALHDALIPFKRGRINLTKIESRPSKLRAWEYYFFVDVDGHADEPRVAKALASLKRHCTEFKVLGSYPMATKSARGRGRHAR